jgi:hypothetical protein
MGLPCILALASLACGAGEKSMTPPPSPAVASASSRPTQPAPLPRLDPQAQLAVRVDAARLRETQFYRWVMASMPFKMVFLPRLETPNKTCGFTILEAFSALAVSVAGDSWVASATPAPSVPPEKILTCVRVLTGGTDGKLDDGTPAVLLPHLKSVALVEKGVIYVGVPEAIRRTVAGESAESPLARSVALSADSVISGRAEQSLGPLSPFAVILKAHDKEFSLDAEVDTESPEAAGKVNKQFFGGPKDDPEIQWLVNGIQIDGKVVRVHFGSEGSPLEPSKAVEAVSIGALFEWQILSLRVTGAKAKVEAERIVPEIARSLRSAVEHRRNGPGLATFPLSAPPVPKDVPAGQRYKSTDAEWSGTWKDIGFSLQEPQYFRYSIVTAPDRKHAVVRAEADFDELSVYEISLEIGGKGDVKQQAMKVTPAP